MEIFEEFQVCNAKMINKAVKTIKMIKTWKFQFVCVDVIENQRRL